MKFWCRNQAKSFLVTIVKIFFTNVSTIVGPWGGEGTNTVGLENLEWVILLVDTKI
jgi:hypothetical protein